MKTEKEGQNRGSTQEVKKEPKTRCIAMVSPAVKGVRAESMSVGVVEKRGTSRRNALTGGMCLKQFSEVGGKVYRLHQAKLREKQDPRASRREKAVKQEVKDLKEKALPQDSTHRTR